DDRGQRHRRALGARASRAMAVVAPAVAGLGPLTLPRFARVPPSPSGERVGVRGSAPWHFPGDQFRVEPRQIPVHTPMEIGAGGAARRAERADHLALRDLVAAL